MAQVELAAEVAAYYERGGEDTRLRAGEGRIELVRTQDVLRRVLDVGGGSGVYAKWLPAADATYDAVLLLGPFNEGLRPCRVALCDTGRRR